MLLNSSLLFRRCNNLKFAGNVGLLVEVSSSSPHLCRHCIFRASERRLLLILGGIPERHQCLEPDCGSAPREPWEERTAAAPWSQYNRTWNMLVLEKRGEPLRIIVD